MLLSGYSRTVVYIAFLLRRTAVFEMYANRPRSDRSSAVCSIRAIVVQPVATNVPPIIERIPPLLTRAIARCIVLTPV